MSKSENPPIYRADTYLSDSGELDSGQRDTVRKVIRALDKKFAGTGLGHDRNVTVHLFKPPNAPWVNTVLMLGFKNVSYVGTQHHPWDAWSGHILSDSSENQDGRFNRISVQNDSIVIHKTGNRFSESSTDFGRNERVRINGMKVEPANYNPRPSILLLSDESARTLKDGAYKLEEAVIVAVSPSLAAELSGFTDDKSGFPTNFIFAEKFERA